MTASPRAALESSVEIHRSTSSARVTCSTAPGTVARWRLGSNSMLNSPRLAGCARTAAAVLVAAAAIFSVTGCTPDGSKKQNTITLDQAHQRANTYAQEVSAALPDKPSLVPNSGGIIDTECTDPDDNGPQGRMSAGGSFFLQDISQERIPRIVDFFHDYLTQRGFKVRTQESDFLVMVNPKDGFRIGLQEGGEGSNKSLGLIVSSPCVWPNGHPVTAVTASRS